MTPYSSCS